MAEQTGRFDDQYNGNGDETYKHHPVGFQVVGRNGLGIADQNACNQNAHGAPETSHDTNSQGIDQYLIPPSTAMVPKGE